MDEAEIQKDLEEKQNYLRSEIIDKNYDAEEFSDFVKQYKENGSDLNNWTFDELKEAVAKFKNKGNNQSKEEEEKTIEKGVENIRQSYNLSSIVYPDMELVKNTDNSINNNLKINYNYEVINYNNLQNYNNDNNNSNNNNNNSNNNNNNNNNDNINDNININKNNQNIINDVEMKNKNDSSIINQDSDINKKEEQNQNNSNNNQNTYPEIDNKPKEYAEFEIYDESNINNAMKELIQCVKQSENSLTKKNNLYVTLES